MGLPKPNKDIKNTLLADNPEEMRKVFAKAGLALKALREECQNLGEIAEGHYSVVWHDFYGGSYYRVNYEEGITPVVIFESYMDSAETGTTIGLSTVRDAEEYIESEATWLFEHLFSEK